MKHPLPLLREELRRHGRRLLQRARKGDATALERLARLRSFADLPSSAIAERSKLKHALAAVAEDAGFPSWLAAKAALDPTQPEPALWERSLGTLLNRWFARYDEARASLERQGGFLFPYRHQFFVCESEGVRLLGLDPDDPDWQRIGHDWVQPQDLAAWSRLRERRRNRLRS